MASFYSPVEAPAPDSAMNHVWLMGISHTHPIDTHPHTNTNQGNPYSLRQKMLLQQTVSYILTLLSTACEILIDYRLFGVLCCTFNISGNVTFTYLQRGKCDPIVFLWMGIVWHSNIMMHRLPPPLKRVSIAPAVAKWAVLTEEDTVYSRSIVCLFSLVYYVALPSAQQMK